MIANRSFSIIYKLIYIFISIVGIVSSLGFFDNKFRWDFYLHFTNVSNYACMYVVFYDFICQVRHRKLEVPFMPFLRFMCTSGIILTFLVFNILLSSKSRNTNSLNFIIRNTTLHVILPIMYCVYWFVFCKNKKISFNYPLLSVIFPILYIVYIYVHAFLFKFDTRLVNSNGDAPLIYPYFFLNPESKGVSGVVKYCIILFFVYLVISYILLFIDITKKKIKANRV